MKLIEASPRWMVTNEGVRFGVSFDCPVPQCKLCSYHTPTRIFVPFANALDDDVVRKGWSRTGSTFETLTLTPSILQHEHDAEGHVVGEHWHGYLVNGELRSC